MNTLIELQNRFQHYLMHANAGLDRRSDHRIPAASTAGPMDPATKLYPGLRREFDGSGSGRSGGQGPNASIEKNIVSTEDLSAQARLAIYAEAYHARLIDALSSNYPVLYEYMGHEAFERVGLAYLQQYPSTFSSIRWFGDQFPDFLGDVMPNAMWLSALAHVEWMMTLIFDAADAPCLGLDEVASIPPNEWGSMQFIFHPSVQMLSLSWNVMAIWHAVIEKKMPPEPFFGEPISWIGWRQHAENRFCSLSSEEAWAIQLMRQGHVFGALCEGLCTWVPEEEAPMLAASWVKGWVSEGLIERVLG